MNPAGQIAVRWHDLFNRFAGDLYPGRYNLATCRELAEKALEIRRLAVEKGSKIPVHYYLYPEFHEIADKLGDSLALTSYIGQSGASRIDFQAVYFMGATAKMITGDKSRIFVSDSPKALGCSLVFGTDHEWIERWKKNNPGGVLVTYINSAPYTKSISAFCSTSRNTDKIIAFAVKTYPGKKILVLPDKFLGYVMKTRALELLKQEGITVDPDLIDVYDHAFGGFNACCYVHEKLGHDAIEVAMADNPEAELMIHPECGCASSCLYKLSQGIIPNDRAFFLSTEQMLQRAKTSTAEHFIVATEPGMLYALRKNMPDKKFIPVSAEAHCDYMKANTFDKLLRSLREDKLEIVLCHQCKKCSDPKQQYEDDGEIHIPLEIAESARRGIDRMLAIQ